MKDSYNVSASPHIFSQDSVQTIMKDVIIALIPAGILGTYNFGIKALLVILTCIVSCLLTEYLYEKFMKLPLTTGDLSAVVTGMLLGLNMPVNAPLWMGVLGSIFAILVVKMLFGGIGQNFMNPALGGRVFLVISFSSVMSNFKIENLNILEPKITDFLMNGALAIDGVSGATPLAALKAGESVDILKIFFANISGTIGETSAAALLVGGFYLLIKKVIRWRIPVVYIVSFLVFIAIFGGQGFDLYFLLAHLLGGGLLLGAIFMATDYTTSPVIPQGEVVYAIMLGIMTGVFRIYGNTGAGVSYAIIFCNLFVPLIDKYIRPRYFGEGVAANE